MSWHTDAWPGLLALLCSGRLEDEERCCRRLAIDWMAFKRCNDLGSQSLFLKNIALMSKFNSKPLSEVVHMLPSEGHKLEPEHLQQLRELSTCIWGGWGADKIGGAGQQGSEGAGVL